jgi:SAM-dependent methyltransferase
MAIIKRVNIRRTISKHLPDSLRPLALRISLSIPANPFSSSLRPSRILTHNYGIYDNEAAKHRLLRRFIEHGLKTDSKVLDVGCGIGKVAVPLTEYLDANGGYEGFDIVSQGIKWCKRRIETRYPNFHFQLVDVYNKFYNPKGKIKPSEFLFPYEDNTFDFVILTSVFTHMITQDFNHYLSQITRVLKNRSGKSLITYFLLNENTMSLVKGNKTHYNFRSQLDENCYARNIDNPEMVVGYNESFVFESYKKCGLVIENVSYGRWRDKNSEPSQDMIIARKEALA